MHGDTGIIVAKSAMSLKQTATFRQGASGLIRRETGSSFAPAPTGEGSRRGRL